MASTNIDVVDIARSFKDIISCTDIKFSDIDLKNKILGTDDDAFLKVTKCIGSDITIISVDDIDDNYVVNAILGG